MNPAARQISAHTPQRWLCRVSDGARIANARQQRSRAQLSNDASNRYAGYVGERLGTFPSLPRHALRSCSLRLAIAREEPARSLNSATANGGMLDVQTRQAGESRAPTGVQIIPVGL